MRVRKNILLITIPLLLIIVACFGVYQRYVFHASKICTNLVKNGYYSTKSECSFSGNEYDVISGFFPIGEVNYEYVITGMDGFRIVKEYSIISSGRYKNCDQGNEIEVIEIEIVPGFFRGKQSFDFRFCHNSLVDLVWNE